jgi:radical SAM superfamily enzyme YgiQ (UPF0313 family)
MKILFVRPNLCDLRSSDAMEPLAFAILAALTPPEHSVELADERLAPVPFDADCDLVAITVETYNARRAYQIAQKFRERGVPVVLGGYHVSFLPDEALQFCDAVVAGDAEGLWPQVLADAREGKMRGVYRTAKQPPIGGIAPDRSLFKDKKYAPLSLVQYGRGCRFACDFCSIHAFYGTSLRQRPVGEVVAEIESLNRKHIFLVDDNIFVDIARAEELFKALIPLKIKWSCQISIDIAANQTLMDLMAKSGCFSAVIGFESLDERNLRQMKKKWNLKDQSYDEAVKEFHGRGIMIYASFVLGYDADGPSTWEKCVEWALKSKFFIANFNPLTPTPGAALFDRLKREERLIWDKWWLADEFRYGAATFVPRGMTPDELSESCYRARQAFNSYPNIARRAAGSANRASAYHAGVFWVSNLVAHREIHRKQGLKLGDGTPLQPNVLATENHGEPQMEPGRS